jgi:putative ABC transport system permease protein
MTLTGFALNNMARRPARTFLTILGIALAIGTAVALLALGRGINESISRGFDEHGAELIVTPRRSTDLLNSRLAEGIAAEIGTVEGVADADGRLFAFAVVDDDKQILLAGWPDASSAWERIPLKEGRLPAQGERALLIGDVLAESIGLGAGATLDLYDGTYTISGISEYRTAMNRGMAIMPLSLLQEAALRQGQISIVSVRLDPSLDQAASEAVSKAITDRFPVTISATQEVADTNYNIKVLRAISGAVSAVALVMGALNLLGTLLMSVQERTREIGMLTAMGWSGRRVVSLIMMEGIIIGVAGCAGGVAVGIAASSLFGSIPTIGNFISFTPDTGDLALPLVLSLPLCAVGAAYPAWRATRLLPAEALRRL